jgi:hypothetical protein
MNCNGREMKRPWSVSGYYPGIGLEGLRKTKKIIRQDICCTGRDSNRASPEYESEPLSPEPTCLVVSEEPATSIFRVPVLVLLKFYRFTLHSVRTYRYSFVFYSVQVENANVAPCFCRAVHSKSQKLLDGFEVLVATTMML